MSDLLCQNCNKPGARFGFLAPSGFIPACSLMCKTTLKSGIAKPRKAAAGSGNVKNDDPAGQAKRDRRAAARKLTPSEGDISKTIAKDLDGAGIWQTRTQAGGVLVNGHWMNLCRTGTPDRIFVDGVHVWLEIKRKGEKPTADQIATHRRLRANGALVFILDNTAEYYFLKQTIKGKAKAREEIARAISNLQAEIDSDLAAWKDKQK